MQRAHCRLPLRWQQIEMGGAGMQRVRYGGGVAQHEIDGRRAAGNGRDMRAFRRLVDGEVREDESDMRRDKRMLRIVGSAEGIDPRPVGGPEFDFRHRQQQRGSHGASLVSMRMPPPLHPAGSCAI